MVHFRFAAILSLITFFAIIAGCSGGSKNAANAVSQSSPIATKANSAKTNVEELSVLINFPYVTEDIVWKEDDANSRLIAVFRLSPSDAAKLVTESEKIRPGQSVNLSSESWFPAELIAQSSMSGDDTLNGKSYAANGFLQPPYKSGTLARIDNTDFFVLEVSAK